MGSTFLLSFIVILISTVASLGPLKPMHIDYAISKIRQRQKEQFVDEHNKYRSLVNPPAANMEYMVRCLFVCLFYLVVCL